METGGGQLYIDFPISSTTVENWRSFFQGITEDSRTNGPEWNFKLKSLGVFQGIQQATIYQRRPATFSITEQNINSTNSKRVFAWMPDLTGFPEPTDPGNNATSAPDSLYVYIARLENGEYWAGWFHASKPQQNWQINQTLNRMFTQDDGYLELNDDVGFDVSAPNWPFVIIQT